MEFDSPQLPEGGEKYKDACAMVLTPEILALCTTDDIRAILRRLMCRPLTESDAMIIDPQKACLTRTKDNSIIYLGIDERGLAYQISIIVRDATQPGADECQALHRMVTGKQSPENISPAVRTWLETYAGIGKEVPKTLQKKGGIRNMFRTLFCRKNE